MVFPIMLSLCSTAQVTQDWARTFGRQFEDRSAAVALGPNRNVYVSGRSAGDFVVMCYSPGGDSLARMLFPAYGSPAGGALVVDNDGYAYLTGYDYAAWPTSDQTLTIKCDPFGHLQQGWVTRMGETSFGRAIAVDDSANVYVTGEAYWEDMFLVKYSRQGLVRWKKILNFGYYDNGIAVRTDHQGHAYVLVRSNHDNSYANFLLIKFDTVGDTLWTARYQGAGQGATPVAMALDAAGNIYVSGTIYTGLAERENFATLKYDPDGHLKWQAVYNGPVSYTDQVTGMALDDSANVLVTGSSSGLSGDLALVKYDSSGNQKWVSRFDYYETNNDAGQVCTGPGGEVYVTGTVTSLNSVTNSNIVTVKYDRNGTCLWNRIYGSPDSLWDVSSGIIADLYGNVYVSGTSASAAPGNSFDWVTVKYAQGINHVEGTLANGQDTCYEAAVTLDVAGNGTEFHVTGGSSAILAARQNILFHAGTMVEPGGYLWGHIVADGPMCQAPARPAGLNTDNQPVPLSGPPSLHIYPNPATRGVSVTTPEPGLLTILSIEGRQMFRQQTGTSSLYLDLSGWTPGVYLVKLVGATSVGVGRFVKQ